MNRWERRQARRKTIPGQANESGNANATNEPKMVLWRGSDNAFMSCDFGFADGTVVFEWRGPNVVNATYYDEVSTITAQDVDWLMRGLTTRENMFAITNPGPTGIHEMIQQSEMRFAAEQMRILHRNLFSSQAQTPGPDDVIVFGHDAPWGVSRETVCVSREKTLAEIAGERTAKYLADEYNEHGWLGYLGDHHGNKLANAAGGVQNWYDAHEKQMQQNWRGDGWGWTRCAGCGAVKEHGHIGGCVWDSAWGQMRSNFCDRIQVNLPGVHVDVADPDTLKFPNHVGVEPAGASERYQKSRTLNYGDWDAPVVHVDLPALCRQRTRNALLAARARRDTRLQNDEANTRTERGIDVLNAALIRAQRRRSTLEALVRLGIVGEQQAERLRNSPGFEG